ncbi:MAG: protein translocase subunit SecF [Burkholderiaceae bacterium]
MNLFPFKRDIPFMRHALAWNMVSIVMFLLAVFFLSTRGLNLSIEFTGGTVMETRYQNEAPIEPIREFLEEMGYPDAQVQNFGTSHDALIRLPLREGLSSDAISEQVRERLVAADPTMQVTRVEFVGPQVGEELATDGAMAVLFVVIGIMIYLAMRFEWKFAVSTVTAIMHDVVIILGFFSFFRWEFSLSVLAATLAVAGYSVNESVVVFDRIRENFRRMRKASTVEVINNAITRTMSRTIITHGSTQMMVLSMLFFGGPTLHYFAIALTIGIFCGIYSSIFVGSAVAMWLGLKREDMVKSVRKDDGQPELP